MGKWWLSGGWSGVAHCVWSKIHPTDLLGILILKVCPSSLWYRGTSSHFLPGVGLNVPLCFTSPNYCGYKFQQIFFWCETNPQKGTSIPTPLYCWATRSHTQWRWARGLILQPVASYSARVVTPSAALMSSTMSSWAMWSPRWVVQNKNNPRGFKEENQGIQEYDVEICVSMVDLWHPHAHCNLISFKYIYHQKRSNSKS